MKHAKGVNFIMQQEFLEIKHTRRSHLELNKQGKRQYSVTVRSYKPPRQNLNSIYGLIKVVQDPCQKITKCFLKCKSYLYCLKTYKYWRSQKNIIYQHVCMTKYILTIWSSFTPQCVPSYTWSGISGRKS